MRASFRALKNEERLLALIAESSASAEGCGEALGDTVTSLFQNAFDWDYFTRLAMYHDYLSAAYRLFKDLEILRLMPDRLQRLSEHEYLLSQARFIKKESELLAIIQEMKNEHIDPIVIKGAPLAYLLYRDPGIRISKDIDILICPSDVEVARNAMLRSGYSLYTGLGSAEDYRDYHFHYIFTRGEKRDSIVEIHWSLVYPNTDQRVVDDNAIREEAIPVVMRDAVVRTLGLPHALWHISVHLSYESFLVFRNFADLKRIALKLTESDWHKALQWSRRCNTAYELSLALNLCESLFGRFLDPGIRESLKVGFFSRTFILGMYYPRALLLEWLPFFDTHHLAMDLVLRKTVASKLRCMYRFIVPDRLMAGRFCFTMKDKRIGSRIKYHLKGTYVLLKVIALLASLAFIVRSRVFGAGFLDPERHQKLS